MEKKSQPKKSKSKDFIIILLILAISFTAISLSFKNMKFAAGADEGYYFKYASYIGEKGISGFSDLFKDYVQNQQHWLFPNPLRIGFIILSSIWLKVFGNSLLNLAYFSLACFYILLFCSYYFVRKYFGQNLALLFTLLLAFSPLNMAMARRALMDSASNLFLFLSIWFFLESTKDKKLSKTVLFVLIYSTAILIKETAVLLSVFFLLYILVNRIIFKHAVSLKNILAVTVLPFSIVGIIYITLAGGVSWVSDTIEIILNSPKNNQYAIIFGSGPWFRYLIDWILLSPWVFVLALGFCFYYFMKNEWKEEIIYLLMLLVIFTFLFSFFTKNIRYVIILDVPIRLFALLMLNELIGKVFKKNVFILLTIFVIALSLYDYFNFYGFFVNQDIYDPVTQWLLQAKHIVPWQK